MHFHTRNAKQQAKDFSPDFALAILEQATLASERLVERFGSTDVAMGDVFRVGRGERTWPLGGETIDTSEIPS